MYVCMYVMYVCNVCMSFHVMSCHVMSCHVMSCHVMSCHVMSCHVMSCHVMYGMYVSIYIHTHMYVYKHIIYCQIHHHPAGGAMDVIPVIPEMMGPQIYS